MTYTDEGFREKTPAEEAAGTGKEGGDSKEYGFSIGGPIIKDKMHFFLTYEAKEFTTPNTVQAPQLFDDNNQELDWVGALTPELRENYGPVANPFDEDLFFVKLDWELGYSDRLELSGKSREETPAVRRGRRGRRVRGIDLRQRRRSPGAALGALRRALLQRSDGHLRRHARLTVEGRAASPGRRTGPWGPRATVSTPSCRSTASIRSATSSRRRAAIPSRTTSRSPDLSWHGDHTIKTGVKFKDVELEMRDASTEALYSFFVDPAIPDAGVEADPFQVTFGAQADTDLHVTSTSKNRQYGIYLQDDWVVNDKLLLNLGVRYDYEETPTYTDYVTPQRFVDAIFALDTNGCASRPRTILLLRLQLQRRLSRLATRPDLRGYAGQRRHRHQRLHQQRQQPQQSERPDRAAVRLLLRHLRRPGARDLRRRRPGATTATRSASCSTRPTRRRCTFRRSSSGTPTTRHCQPNTLDNAFCIPWRRRVPDAGRPGVDRAGQLRGDALHQQQAEGALFRPVHARHAQPGGRLEHEHRVGVHHELRRRDRKPRRTALGTAPGTGTTRATTRSMKRSSRTPAAAGFSSSTTPRRPRPRRS